MQTPFPEPSQRAALAEIEPLAAKVASPANYWKGRGIPQGILPGNILCFVRHSAAELSGPASQHRSQHHHHRCILLVAVRGSGRVCLDSESFGLAEGEAQLISPFQFHSYMEIQPEAICWIFLTFETLAPAEIEPLRSSPSRALGPAELMVLRELVRCWLDGDPHNLLALHLGLLLGRLRAMRRPASPFPAASGAAGSGTDVALLSRVNGYILPRLGKPLGLQEVAQALGDSESYLRARFRRATGYSLGRHLRQLRIQKACSLLHTTGLSVGEIAECCGFDSVYAFSRTFKVARGVSPRAYRQGVYAPEKTGGGKQAAPPGCC